MEQPTTFHAGDSVTWSVSLPDYPASAGWTLKYRLLSQAGIAQDIATTGTGDTYTAALSAATTAAWSAGKATLVKIVEKGADRITLDAPLVTILPDLETASNHDGRTANERALADAEAALEAYLAAGQSHVDEYEVAGRRMKFRAVAEIEALINLYRLRVAKDNAAKALLAGGAVSGRVYYRG